MDSPRSDLLGNFYSEYGNTGKAVLTAFNNINPLKIGPENGDEGYLNQAQEFMRRWKISLEKYPSYHLMEWWVKEILFQYLQTDVIKTLGIAVIAKTTNAIINGLRTLENEVGIQLRIEVQGDVSEESMEPEEQRVVEIKLQKGQKLTIVITTD